MSLPDTAIADFTDTIINALTGNAGFPTPAVPLATLATQKTDFLTKLAAVAKNDAWGMLTGSLRQLAAYVQSLAANDLNAVFPGSIFMT